MRNTPFNTKWFYECKQLSDLSIQANYQLRVMLDESLYIQLALNYKKNLSDPTIMHYIYLNPSSYSTFQRSGPIRRKINQKLKYTLTFIF